MERVELYCRGERLGEVILTPEGVRTQVRCAMDDPGDGLYRAFLRGAAGELPLGVLAPEEGRLALCRLLYSRDLTALGPLERGEARRSFAFAAPCWRETRCPAQLFRESFFQRRPRPLGRAWWRREGELLLLALPLEPGAPFPLEALFCLGRVEQVEGTRCVVYAFREEEPAIF